jgi:5-(carboxyamino)imidazole ribonucleotide mutase
MKEAYELFKSFDIDVEVKVISVHRTPEYVFSFGKDAKNEGFEVIIAGVGGAEHLPGVIASLTTLPVIGVPIPTKQLNGLDSLLSIVQMPYGVPVATVGIGNAKNAALLALRILSIKYEGITHKLKAFAEKMKNEVLFSKLEL